MDPIIASALVVSVGAAFGGPVSGGGGPTPPTDGRWVFPVERWRNYRPTRSQEYRAPDHHGVDIMFARQPGGDDQMWRSGIVGVGELAKSYGNSTFFFPDNVYTCAARDGTLWAVGDGKHGKFVVIDHGRPFATYYTHLSSVEFPPLQRGAGAIRVSAGQRLGVTGFSPFDAAKLMHLHFEVWYRGGSGSHIDPWPLLARAPLPNQSQGAIV